VTDPDTRRRRRETTRSSSRRLCFFSLFLKGEREAVLVVGLFLRSGWVGGWERVVDEGDFWKMPNNTSFFISDQWPV
jgi:hypothetical protein